MHAERGSRSARSHEIGAVNIFATSSDISIRWTRLVSRIIFVARFLVCSFVFFFWGTCATSVQGDLVVYRVLRNSWHNQEEDLSRRCKSKTRRVFVLARCRFLNNRSWLNGSHFKLGPLSGKRFVLFFVDRENKLCPIRSVISYIDRYVTRTIRNVDSSFESIQEGRGGKRSEGGTKQSRQKKINRGKSTD